MILDNDPWDFPRAVHTVARTQVPGPSCILSGDAWHVLSPSTAHECGLWTALPNPHCPSQNTSLPHLFPANQARLSANKSQVSKTMCQTVTSSKTLIWAVFSERVHVRAHTHTHTHNLYSHEYTYSALLRRNCLVRGRTLITAATHCAPRAVQRSWLFLNSGLPTLVVEESPHFSGHMGQSYYLPPFALPCTKEQKERQNNKQNKTLQPLDR